PSDAAAADKQVMRWTTPTNPGTLEYNGSYYGGGISQLFAPPQAYDANYNIVDHAVQFVEKNADSTLYTYRVPDGAKWSNGQPMTAEDWVFSFKYAVDPKRTTNSAATLFYEIKGAEDYHKGSGSLDAIGVKAVDERTFQIEMRRPFALWPLINAYWSSTPVYKPAVEQYGESWTQEGRIVSNGPFKLDSWKQDQVLTAVPNEGWVGEKPLLSRLEYYVIGPEAGILPYENDEVDFVIIPAQEWPRVRADAKLKEQVQQYAEINTWYLVGEVTQPPFDDKRVRLAMHKAIDRDTLSERVLQGLGVPAYDFIAPEIPIGRVGDEPEVQALLKYDPKGALAALKGTAHEGGTNWPSTITLGFPNTRDPAVSRPMSEAIALMLRETLKMPVEVQGVENRTYVAQQFSANRPYHLSMWAWTADYPHPENYWLPVFSSTPPIDKRRHAFSDKEFDELIAKAGGITDEREQENVYKQIGRRLITEAHATPLIHRRRADLYKPRVGGLPRNEQGEIPQSNIFRMWNQFIYIKKT
ncbi:MAG: peptide ABC transporter substrate-binding protein, partial [Dehalococcoidia bacterium]